ncbi:MAG: hypothetical protein ACFCUX_01920 [Candidatus Methylacidiphilales bacterium]
MMPVFPDQQASRMQSAPVVDDIQYQDGNRGLRTVAEEAPEPSVEGAASTVQSSTETAPGHNGLDGLPVDADLPIRLSIISPSDRQVLNTETVDIFFSLENYILGEKGSGGNRVHYILDNRDPEPVYDAVKPITFKGLSQGGHSLRLFAVRPDGTMFRNPEAFAMVHFYLGRKDFQNYTDPDRPFLTVNLPTGNQIATDEEGRVIFDYMIHHATEGDGHQVKYKLGSYEGFINQPGPVHWANLAVGKHALQVELLRSSNQPVIGPFNRVEREFTVERVMRAVLLDEFGNEIPPTDVEPTVQENF